MMNASLYDFWYSHEVFSIIEKNCTQLVAELDLYSTRRYFQTRWASFDIRMTSVVKSCNSATCCVNYCYATICKTKFFFPSWINTPSAEEIKFYNLMRFASNSKHTNLNSDLFYSNSAQNDSSSLQSCVNIDYYIWNRRCSEYESCSELETKRICVITNISIIVVLFIKAWKLF